MQDNTNSVKDKQIRVDLIRVLMDVRDEFLQKLWLWAAISLVIGVIGFVSAKTQYTPNYVASTSFTVSKHLAVNYHTSIEKSTVSNWIGILAPDVIGGETMKELVKDDLGYLESDSLPATISVSSVKDSNVVSVRVRAADPQIAYDVLESVKKNYLANLAATTGGGELEILDESGVPTAPANSSGARNAGVKAFLAGLFLCLVWLTAKAILKKTVRGEEDLTTLLGDEYLGKIPMKAYVKSRKSKAANGKASAEASAGSVPAEFADAIRKVRLHLENKADQTGAKTILVTSAIRDEGKTATAAHLALSLAKKNYNVLLIDGDLRAPAVHTTLDIGPVNYGTADILAGKCSISQALVNYKGNEHLVIIPGSKPVDNPEELWGSAKAEEMIRKCSRQCDYVIIDAPAGGLVAEPALIAGCSDGWIYVVREDYAHTETIQEGRETMEGAGCELMGLVLTA